MSIVVLVLSVVVGGQREVIVEQYFGAKEGRVQVDHVKYLENLPLANVTIRPRSVHHENVSGLEAGTYGCSCVF